MQESILESSPEIPIGFCQCGCGQKTKIALKASSRDKWVKGQPLRFINKHQCKWLSNNKEYKEKMRHISRMSAKRGENHPNYRYGIYQTVKDKRWYVRSRNGQHVQYSHVVIEGIIGRELLSDEVVHHINKDFADDRPDNLKLMKRGEHARHHRLEEKNKGLQFGRNRYRPIHLIAICHPNLPNHGKGLCKMCYQRNRYRQSKQFQTHR